MTTTQHSNHLLEELVAEEIVYQIDQIAEELQREGWPIAMVKRFMHVAVERLPECGLPPGRPNDSSGSLCGALDNHEPGIALTVGQRLRHPR